MAGQRPFHPPNVSGWDEERWLDTSTYRGRWYAVSTITRKDQLEGNYSSNETAAEAVDKALRYWGNPVIDEATVAGLHDFCASVEGAIEADWQKDDYRRLRQNALRVMIAMSPEMQTS
jgi:hypothetical protein